MLDLEAIKARLEEPGMGHLIEDACTLLEEVERLRAENERIKTAAQEQSEAVQRDWLSPVEAVALKAEVAKLHHLLFAAANLTITREEQLLEEIHREPMTFRKWLAQEMENPTFRAEMENQESWYQLHRGIIAYRNQHGTWKLLRQLVYALAGGIHVG